MTKFSLMQLMGLKVIYRRPRISPPGPSNKIYPYLLNGMKITRPNQPLDLLCTQQG
jgi:putative transposase